MDQVLITLIVRVLIYFTPTITAVPYPQKKGITSKVGHNFVFMYLLAIKSFFYFSKLKLSVCIIEDGSLTPQDFQLLKQHVKNIHIITNTEANIRIRTILSQFPFCLRYRAETHSELYDHNTYVFDPILIPTFEKYMLIDADIIFFQEPKELIHWFNSETNVSLYMSFAHDYAISELRWGRLILLLFSKKWHSPLPQLFNDGINCGFKKDYYLQNTELCLKRDIYPYGLHKHWLSVVLLSVNRFIYKMKKSGTQKISALNFNKYFILTQNKNQNRKPFTRTCIHYISGNKEKYLPKDALNLLLKTRLLR